MAAGNNPRPQTSGGGQVPQFRPPPPNPYHGLFQSPPAGTSPFQVHVGGASPPFSTIGGPGASGGTAKRPPAKPPSRPIAAPSNATASPAASYRSADLTPAAKRKKQKLPEKQLPDRVAALLPESALYTQLLEFESRVDAALARKKADIQEALKNPPSVQRTLRVYVFNTFANQTVAGPPGNVAEPPSWSLKIIGRVLDDANADIDLVPSRPNPMYPKFSAFFKRVTIGLDQSLYPENPLIIWENSRSAAQTEGFEVKRKGDKEFTANICLDMNYVPEKFRLSPALVEVLGIEVDTRARVIAGLWQYVKAKKLQNPTDPSFFACDPALRKVFGEDKVRFATISQKISPHLAPPQPINLEHRIRLSGNGAVGTACYDIQVDVPFPLQKDMAQFLANTEKHKDIEACDEVICNSIKRIHEHRRRRAFFLGFSQSPVEFINALIASQSKDLKLVAGEASRNADRERRSDFYNQPWVEDAVIRYLNRKPAGGNDAPPTT